MFAPLSIGQQPPRTCTTRPRRKADRVHVVHRPHAQARDRAVAPRSPRGAGQQPAGLPKGQRRPPYRAHWPVSGRSSRYRASCAPREPGQKYNALTGRSRCASPQVSASSEVERAKARRTQPTHATARRAYAPCGGLPPPPPLAPHARKKPGPARTNAPPHRRWQGRTSSGRVVLQCAPLRTLVQAVRAAHRKRSAQRVGAPINPSASRADSATNEVDTLRGDAPGQLVQARTRHATANEIDRYLGTEENAMNQGHGHKANDMFAPEGAWQSDASASKKCLGYKPFGSLLPGRNYSSGSYRFGFQGQEKDDEIHGSTGTSLAFEYRMHDPRVGRFLSIDPLAAKYAYNSPYAFSENRVIDGVELEGLEWQTVVGYGAAQAGFDTRQNSNPQYVSNYVSTSAGMAAEGVYREDIKPILVAGAHGDPVVLMGGMCLGLLGGMVGGAGGAVIEGAGGLAGDPGVGGVAGKGFNYVERLEVQQARAAAQKAAPLVLAPARPALALSKAPAYAFSRTHGLAGKADSRIVQGIMDDMRCNGWNGDPIKVLEHCGERFILDGHHRVEAARRLGIEVPFESVPPTNLCQYGYESVDQVVTSSCEAGPVKLNVK